MSTDDWLEVYALDVHCPSGIGGHTYSRRPKQDGLALRIALAKVRAERIKRDALHGEQRHSVSVIRVREMEAVTR